jgi:hypothetical protein
MIDGVLLHSIEMDRKIESVNKKERGIHTRKLNSDQSCGTLV